MGKRQSIRPAKVLIQSSPVQDISWNTDGKLLAALLENGTLSVWNTDDGEEVKSLGSESRAVRQFEWVKNGSAIIASFADGTFEIITTADWQVMRAFGRDGGGLMRLNPMGNLLAALSVRNSLMIFDITQGLLIHELQVDGKSWSRFAWTPDGMRLFTIDMNDEESIYVWDVATGQSMAILHGMAKRSVNEGGLALSGDGKQIAVARGETVRIYEIETAHGATLFEVACAALLDKSLKGVAPGLPNFDIEPICDDPKNIPLPEWPKDWPELMDAARG